MKKASIVLWNNLNIILCCICGGMAMCSHEWFGAVGWLCATLAWMQSNDNRFRMDRWESVSEKAINVLHWVSQWAMYKVEGSAESGDVDHKGCSKKAADAFVACIKEASRYLNGGTTTFSVAHGGIEIKADIQDVQEM
jgi:hypothetical protein